MNTKTFFFIPIIICLSYYISLQEASAENFKNYNMEETSRGVFTWTSHGDYILDNGIYKPYILTEDANIITLKSIQGSYVFDKNLCAMSFYNSTIISPQNRIIGQDMYFIKGTVVGSSNFSPVNSLNNASCQTSIIQNGDDIEIRGTKHVDNVGDFKIRYIKYAGKLMKTQLEPTNLNPSWTNHKLGITEEFLVPKNVKLGNTTYDLSQQNNTELSRSWLIQNKGNVFELAEKSHYDFSIGFQYINKTSISWNGTDAKLSLDFTFNTPKINVGQTLVIDPTFGYNVGTEYTVEATATAGASCNNAPYTFPVVTSYYTRLGDADLSDTCDVAALKWDISSIPDANATITGASYRFDVLTSGSPLNCNITQLTHDPATTDAETLWNDIRNTANGTTYVSNNSQCASNGNDKIIDLGSSAVADIQATGLTNNYFAIGHMFTQQTRDSTIHQDELNDGELQITWIGQVPDAPTDLRIVGNRGSQIDLSWTTPSLNSSVLSGYQVNYTTPWALPQTIIVNNTGSSNTNYTVTGLTGQTNYSFRVGTWTTYDAYNGSGNIANATTILDFTAGTGTLNYTNTDLFPIRFERTDINDTALNLNVTYPISSNLTCNFHYKFAMTNNSYYNFARTNISSTESESTFQFLGVNNEIIDALCSDLNSNNTGKYIIVQNDFPLLEQIQNFTTNGTYGTQGDFGTIDFITLIVIIISMLAFNRINETVGAVFNIAFLSTMAFFEIIELPTLIFGAIAVALMLAVATTRKD